MFERVFSILFFSLGLVVSQLGFASEFREGIHYQTLAKPVVTSGQEKIEVVELFWYGCPHCDSLDPALKVWVERLPADVNFVQIPVVFGRSWEMHARIFWVAKNINTSSSGVVCFSLSWWVWQGCNPKTRQPPKGLSFFSLTRN